MLRKLYRISFCTDLVIDIDIDIEKVYFTTRYTGVVKKKKKTSVEKILKKYDVKRDKLNMPVGNNYFLHTKNYYDNCK